MTTPVPVARIEQTIHLVRDHRVMLDSDLASLDGVTTFNLNKAVKRNSHRFPEDFMFQLTTKEARDFDSKLECQKWQGSGGRRYLPYVFTEQGVAMLSSVLRSKRAIQVNIAIMRAFVKLRELAVNHKTLAAKLAQLERQVESHDSRIRSLFEAIRQLMVPTTTKSRRIGFST